MADHRAAVVVNAAVHQVYTLFTHFNDYPKFMTSIKEVTYLDDRRSHWVVDVAGRHEWDAVNEDWIPDAQVGWRSISGLANSGRVIFTAEGADRTRVEARISYEPPAGALGALAESLGAGASFEHRLQTELSHFATMVESAPPGSLDPTSSTYLFHDASAAAKGVTTDSQDQTMGVSAPGGRMDADVPTTSTVAGEIDAGPATKPGTIP